MKGMMSRYRFPFLVLFLALGAGSALSQVSDTLSTATEQFPIEFEVRRVGSIEVLGLQSHDEVYLPVQPIFDYLRIKNQYDPVEGVLSGFFVSPDTPYVINTRTLKARVGNRSMTLQPDEIAFRGTTVYVRPGTFNTVFGLAVEYLPRQLKATLTTQIPLPIFLDQRIRRLEAALAARPARLQPEATFDRQFSFLDAGRLDYTFLQTFYPQVKPFRTFTTRLTGIALGGDVEARAVGNLSSGLHFTQTRARWRYVPLRSPLVKQIVVGDYVSSGLLPRETYGIQLTNTPANPRILFAEETFRGQLESGRPTYLFKGSTLESVDHDTTGGYDFYTDLRYGVNLVNITEFGHWGETYGFTRRISIPYTLVPPAEIDYGIALGRMRGAGNPWYGDLSFQWGITSRVTAGARTEYFGVRALPTSVYPSFSVTARLTDHLIGETVVSPNALVRGTLDLTLPSLAGGSFAFTDYRRVHLFNPRNAINDLSGLLYLPFSTNGSRFAVEVSGTQTILQITRERRLRLGLSAFLGIISPRITTQYAWIHSYNTPETTQLVFRETEPSIRVRLPGNLFVSVGAPYDHLRGKVRNARFSAVVQPLPSLFFEFQYDRSFIVQSTVARLRLQYTFPFARVTAGSTFNNEVIYDQSITGSIGAAPRLGELFFENTSFGAGFGGIILAPFVDANGDGIRNADEPVISSATLRASTMGEGGFKLTQIPDVGWVFTRAVPYQDYVVELDQKDFSNPLWIPQYNVLGVSAPPGSYTYVEIPVITGGVVRGRVAQLKGPAEQIGVDFLRVTLREEISEEELNRHNRTRFEKTAETFSTGDFEFIGVPPGNYTVSLESAQVASMKLQGLQLSRPVTIQSKVDGDIVEGVNFVLVERK